MQGLDILATKLAHLRSLPWSCGTANCRQLNIPVSAYLHCSAHRSASFRLTWHSFRLQIFNFPIWRQHWLRLAKLTPANSKSGFFEDVRDLPWWMFLDLRSRIKVENVAVYWAERPLTDCRVRHRNVYGSFGRTASRAQAQGRRPSKAAAPATQLVHAALPYWVVLSSPV